MTERGSDEAAGADATSVSRRSALAALAGGAAALSVPARVLGAPPAPVAASRERGRVVKGGRPVPPDGLVQQVTDYMQATGTPGVAVGVINDLSIPPSIFCFGNATDAGDKVVPETVFGIGSVTKVFTGLMLAALDGEKVSLDDPVAKYLGNWIGPNPQWITQVTLRQLATHSASFPRSGPSGAEVFAGQPPSAELQQWWTEWPNNLRKQPPAPGTHYEYSNLGMVTLAFALAGTQYNALLQQLICKPISGLTLLRPMTHTAPESYIGPRAKWAQGHLDRGGKTIPITTRNSDLNSCPRDLYSYVSALLFYSGHNAKAGPINRALWLSQQVAFQMPASQKQNFDMGLGWQISKSQPTVYTKDGGTTRGGCGCWIGFCPSKGFGLFVMANKFGTGKSSGQSPSTLGSCLFNTVFDIEAGKCKGGAESEDDVE